MNYWYSPLNLLFTLCVFCAGAKGNTFYSLNALNIKNEKVSFEEYKGKVTWFHVFTARKRSLGQGDVFTPICQSFCARRVGCVVKGGVVDTPNPETDTPIDPEADLNRPSGRPPLDPEADNPPPPPSRDDH